jgi:hypothetical protein
MQPGSPTRATTFSTTSRAARFARRRAPAAGGRRRPSSPARITVPGATPCDPEHTTPPFGQGRIARAYDGSVVAPGFGPLGFGIALIAVGGVLVGTGENVAGIVCDTLGVVFLWSGFQGYRDKYGS